VNIPDPECPGCRFLQVKAALLQAEVAGRDAILAQLTEQPGGDAPELAIRGENRPARLVVAGPFGTDPDDLLFRVSLEYWNLRADSQVAGIDAGEFRACFEELARERAGWEGQRVIQSRDSDFSIAWEYEGHHYRPEVWAHVRLGNDWHQPLWTVELSLQLFPEALEELAERARGFFSGPSGA
jgi:hypothetical protein